MGYWFHHVYIDDKEFPTLAKQRAKELEILAEVRQAQASRVESARLEWVEDQSAIPQVPSYWRKRVQGTRREWIPIARNQWVAKPVERIKGEWVYFVLDPNIGLIKIGFTTRLQRRFRELQLQYSKDLQFLGAFKGSLKDETTMHKIFKVFKCDMDHYREWFFDVPLLYKFIHHSAEVKEIQG